jgi:hypothetical protein
VGRGVFIVVDDRGAPLATVRVPGAEASPAIRTVPPAAPPAALTQVLQQPEQSSQPDEDHPDHQGDGHRQQEPVHRRAARRRTAP